MKLSVLIGTCDLYSPLWEPFQITFDRYWKFNTKNLFVGETVEVPNYTDTKFETIISGKGKWGERIRKGIEVCEEEYIFFILEDYFLNYTYSEEQMNTWLVDMKKYDIDRLQISGPDVQRYDNVPDCPYKRFTNNEYLISVQPSIWKKSFLLETINPNYSPWQYEVTGSQVLAKSNIKHNTFVDTTVTNTRKYFNAVRVGFKKSPGWEEFRIKEKLKDF